MPTTEKRKVPQAALKFDAGPLQFAEKAGAESGKTRVKLLARSSQPIEHWYWGKIAHDFGGMDRKDKVPIDYCHDDREILGVLDTFDVTSEGLAVEGDIVSFQEGDRAAEVTFKGKAGIPYEASIDNRGSFIVEEVAPGYMTTVNGQPFEGPGIIFRKWSLRGVAIVPHGADAATKAKFSAESQDDVEVTVFTEGEFMKPETAPATPAVAAAPAAPANQEANPPLQSAQPANPQPTREELLGDLRRYTAKFGAEKGALWFAEGKTYEQSLELFTAQQADEITAAKAEATQFKDKLSSLSLQLGEPAPVSGGDAEKGKSAPPSAYAAKVGTNLARYAESLVKPK